MADEFARGADVLPGESTSPWLVTDTDVPFEPLEEDLIADVAVVGGGIAGLSAARAIRDRGYSVVVLERDRIASGVTGKSTAKVTSQHGLIYDHLFQEFGRDAARQYARVNEAAIDAVESRVQALDIESDCGFERCPAYVYADERDPIQREVDAATAAGLEASFVKSIPPFERSMAAIRVENQAQFDPRMYLLTLATAIDDGDSDSDEGSGTENARICERTRVTNVGPGNPHRVRTANGIVSADHVVLATGFPIVDRAGFFTRLYPKRSYVLGLRIDGAYPEGMYYRHGDPYRSVRTHRGDPDGPLLLVGGENHKTGQGGSTIERYQRLLEWARERFAVREVAYRWSTQDYVPVDRVPFIGQAWPGATSIYVATGFRGWGLTTGVAAGTLLAALIDGESPPEEGLFDPLRITPKQSLPSGLTENVDTASQFATDWLRTLVGQASMSIEPGTGDVIRRGKQPIAISRDDSGGYHAVSAVCPHARCLVDWNDAECTWDCPCHGSRFSPDGTVLEGPATEDLPSRDWDE